MLALSATKQLFAVVVLSCSLKTIAQDAAIHPQTLPAQIREQQATVTSSLHEKDPQAWLKLAVLLQDAAQYAASEHAYRTTIDLLKSPAPLTLADVLDHMGTMYVESGQPRKAEPIERQALAIREEQHDGVGAGVSHMHLAMLLLGEHALQPAETEAKSAVSLLVPEFSSASTNLAASPEEKMTALIDLSLVQHASGSYGAAVSSLRYALTIAHANYPDRSVPVGYLDVLLGNAEWQTGDPKNARTLMHQGVEELASQLGWGHPVYVRVLGQYRDFLLQTGATAEAQDISQRLANLIGAADLAAAQPTTAPH